MKAKTVIHVSTECYPAAKAGGMADVVGSLPKYLKDHGWNPVIVTPRYRLPWFDKQNLRRDYAGSFGMEDDTAIFEVYRLKKGDLPFDYYCIDIPGRFDRNSIYLNESGHGYDDEAERNISFQRSVIKWLNDPKSGVTPDLIHCHDHQTGFIPFLIKNTEEGKALASIPSFYTIHNGAYNSRYSWGRIDLLPKFPSKLSQFIEWDGHIDAVATAIRYADHVNTVSPSYLEELKDQLAPLKHMMSRTPDKFSGTLNGIDPDEWNPKTDKLLSNRLTTTVDQYKKVNKAELLSELYHLNNIPLISFIGRFAHQKGADLLVPAVERVLARFGFVNFFILGSGDPFIERKVQELRDKYAERVGCFIGYNEALAHQVYASSDFIVMPSRFEPCGLNQMFAMRYGALAIARMTGGLKDTVIDFESGGLGVAFDYDSVDDLTHAMGRALHLYRDTKRYKQIRKNAMKMDFSWNQSAKQYISIYNQLIEN